MAHWAELDKDNMVIRVLKTDNDDPNGDEGYDWLVTALGGHWVKTSYNAHENGFRKFFAGHGMLFDEERDAFIYPQPFPSWTFHEESFRWMPPVDYPADGLTYAWDEPSLSWQVADFYTN